MSYCFVVQMGFIVTLTNSFHFTDADKKHSKTTNILLTSFVAASPLSLHSLSLVWPIHWSSLVLSGCLSFNIWSELMQLSSALLLFGSDDPKVLCISCNTADWKKDVVTSLCSVSWVVFSDTVLLLFASMNPSWLSNCGIELSELDVETCILANWLALSITMQWSAWLLDVSFWLTELFGNVLCSYSSDIFLALVKDELTSLLPVAWPFSEYLKKFCPISEYPTPLLFSNDPPLKMLGWDKEFPFPVRTSDLEVTDMDELWSKSVDKGPLLGWCSEVLSDSGPAAEHTCGKDLGWMIELAMAKASWQKPDTWKQK